MKVCFIVSMHELHYTCNHWQVALTRNVVAGRVQTLVLLFLVGWNNAIPRSSVISGVVHTQ